MSDTSQPSLTTSGIVGDIIQWRRKKLSLMVVLIATATWVLLEVYQFKFITVASWVTMFIVASIFLWANMLRLLGKETPSLSGLEITEQSAVEMANSCRERIEGGVRWMFRVGADTENWFVSAGVVAVLWILSLVASCFDLLTLFYIGIMMALAVPVIYEKYEDKINGFGESLKVKGRRIHDMVDERVLKKMGNKVAEMKKEKKVE